MRRTLCSVLLVAAPLLACNKGPSGEEEGQREAVVALPEAQEPTEPVMDATPEGVALDETPFTLLRADSGQSQSATWVVGDATISLRAALVDQGKPNQPRRAEVYASWDEIVDRVVFTCQALDPKAGAYVQLLRRGDNMHVLCVNPPLAAAAGFTDAGRFAFDAQEQKLVSTGTYGGEGIVDPDTIDLDEREE